MAASAAVAALVLALPAAAARDGIGGHSGFLLAAEDVHSLAVLAGGEIVVAGNDVPGAATVRLWRVSADGAYLVRFPRFSSFRCACQYRVLLEADSSERLVLGAGRQVVRLLPSGVRDPSFGASGVAGVGFQITAFAVSPSGEVAVAGMDADGGARLARLAPSGEFDDSFGVVGVARGVPVDVAIQRDGKIVIGLDEQNVGRVPAKGDGPSVLRYAADGTLDPSYGDAGVGVIGDVQVRALALQTDGKLVVGGQAADFHAAVLRLTADGMPDASFGRAGRAPLGRPVLDRDEIADLALQPDGGIVVVGTSGLCCGSRRYAWFAYRFDAAGGARRSGAGPGRENPEILCYGDGADAVRTQRDGRIVVLGAGCHASVITRYRPNLTRDAESRRAFGLAPSAAARPSLSLTLEGRVATARLRVAVAEAARLELRVHAAARTSNRSLVLTGAPVPLRAGTALGAATLRRPSRSIALALPRAATVRAMLRFVAPQSKRQRRWVIIVRVHGERRGVRELMVPWP